jgi:hypothetical protein
MITDLPRPGQTYGRGKARRAASLVAFGATVGLVLAGAAVLADAGAFTVPDRAAVLARLLRLNQSGQFLFGQQAATLWGMSRGGRLVSTNVWFDATAGMGRFTSDSEALVGDHPAVLGVSLQMLAFEPVAWHRRTPVAEAIRSHFAQGGLVTMDWHAPSCTAKLGPVAALATVKIDGKDIALQADEGGTFFYAEEEYAQPIQSRADVPEALKCLCLIANEAPLSAGPYQGMSGKTWLVAHAKQAARVLREQGLSNLPILMRPFHEHNGNWFWWGMPYWNCAALLDKPDAVSGPEAYKTVVRTFVSTLRSEPGMGQLLFAYSPDRLLAPSWHQRFTAAQDKIEDPMETARDRLRDRMVRELGEAGLAYQSPAQASATMTAARATTTKRADTYVAQRRRYYAEAYAGDDIFDVLGIDLYHTIARPANTADLRFFRLQLRTLAEEARARTKPYAWTEAGTPRLRLLQLALQRPEKSGLEVHSKASLERALARLFDPADQAALLRHYRLTVAAPVALDAHELAEVVPESSEDWFNRQLLVLAQEAGVAYVLVWQNYYDSAAMDRDFSYFVPYPGHAEAPSYQRFYAAPATCFLRDGCGR